MSYAVFFSFSTGLEQAIRVPKGTLAAIQQHVKNVTMTLGLRVEKHGDSAPRWVRRLAKGSKSRWLDATEPSTPISDEDYCEIARVHDRWLRRLYADLGKWQKDPVQDGEEITPEDAQTFWYGLVDIDVPPARWTGAYYRNRMEHLYEVMRGRDDEGVSFDEEALTPKQAAAVIRLFDEFLDPADLRLDVPKDRDYLASSSDGGYDWCITHGAVLWEDGLCCDDPECDLHREWMEEHNEDEDEPTEDPDSGPLEDVTDPDSGPLDATITPLQIRPCDERGRIEYTAMYRMRESGEAGVTRFWSLPGSSREYLIRAMRHALIVTASSQGQTLHWHTVERSIDPDSYTFDPPPSDVDTEPSSVT